MADCQAPRGDDRGPFSRRGVETRDDGIASPLFDAVRGGEFDAVHLDASTLVENDPLFAFLGAIPYGMTARQHDAWLRHGNGLATLRPALQRHGVVVFPAGGTGVEMGGWYRREIKGAADLKELKVRAFGVGAGVLARLGVAVQRMPDREVPAALQAGRLDGAVGAGPYDDERQGWYKFARFYYYPLAAGGGHQFVVLVRAEAWAALPADLKAAFEAACTDAGQDVAARYGAQTPRALRQLLANGVQLRPFPPEVARAGLRRGRRGAGRGRRRQRCVSPGPHGVAGVSRRPAARVRACGFAQCRAPPQLGRRTGSGGREVTPRRFPGWRLLQLRFRHAGAPASCAGPRARKSI